MIDGKTVGEKIYCPEVSEKPGVDRRVLFSEVLEWRQMMARYKEYKIRIGEMIWKSASREVAAGDERGLVAGGEGSKGECLSMQCNI